MTTRASDTPAPLPPAPAPSAGRDRTALQAVADGMTMLLALMMAGAGGAVRANGNTAASLTIMTGAILLGASAMHRSRVRGREQSESDILIIGAADVLGMLAVIVGLFTVPGG